LARPLVLRHGGSAGQRVEKMRYFFSAKREVLARSSLGGGKILKKHLLNVYKTYILIRSWYF